MIEAARGGTDTVYSNNGYVLQSNVERLILTGTNKSFGTGNADANVLQGSAGANTLDGKGGSDILIGGAGADVFIFGEGRDQIRDFADNVDRIALRASDLGGLTMAGVWENARDTSAGVVFEFRADQLLVTGATIAALKDDVVLI